MKGFIIMEKLQVGLIATGGRGVHGYEMHKPEKGVEIVAGCDISQEALDKFSEKFPDAQTFTDYRDLLKIESIGAVHIATPDYLHEEMAIAALEAGKAVYLEKPMAITIEGCDRILETAYRTGSKLFIGHNMRHFPVVLKMKEIIDSGLIGEIQVGWCRHFVCYGGDAYFRDWHSEQRYSNGLLLQKGAHDIDVMHWLMGSYTKSVVGMGMLSVYNRCGRRSPDTPGCAKWDARQYPPLTQTGFSPIIDVEDHSMVMMQLENGAQMTYMQCHYTPDAERNYTFIGTKGRIENYGDCGKGASVQVWTQRVDDFRLEGDISYHLTGKDSDHGGADPKIIQGYIDMLRGKESPASTPQGARYAVAAGVLGAQSIRNGGMPYEVPALTEELENCDFSFLKN
jgi:predicted dehydrogenase